MARWGRCDFKQLKRMQKKLETFQEVDLDKFCRDCSREIAARLLRKVIKRTPVGQYSSGSGKTGGTLRRGWTGGSENISNKGNVVGLSGASGYVSTLPITKVGNIYQIEVTNIVEYASYVEFGHRTSNHNGWVPGRFMLTISEQEIQGQIDKIIEKKLMLLLGEVFNGK